MTEQELREGLQYIICKYCDVLEPSEHCELNKTECPVLNKMPNEILALIKEAGGK